MPPKVKEKHEKLRNDMEKDNQKVTRCLAKLPRQQGSSQENSRVDATVQKGYLKFIEYLAAYALGKKGRIAQMSQLVERNHLPDRRPDMRTAREETNIEIFSFNAHQNTSPVVIWTMSHHCN
ncbi:hypothetical protein RUM43_013401 [Polyplax serrata]|uniref:Uncharacterized protein n=1 Tax=Polyplax serrata TaxID=468196 RepID=A0AAN8P5F3_POLSC